MKRLLFSFLFRRIICFFFIVSFALFSAYGCNFKTAHAENVAFYKRVITDNTTFYKDEKCLEPLFYLPYTYYVRIISESAGVTHAVCYGDDGITALDGYIRTDELFIDNLPVKSPYLCKYVSTSDTTTFYSDFIKKNTLQFIFKDRVLSYYGTYKDSDGNNLFYCEYNGRLGYVSENTIYPFTIENHPNELTFLTPDQPETPKPDDKSNTTLSLKIIIISCIAIAGISGLFFVFRPKKKPAVCAGYYDENDFE